MHIVHNHFFVGAFMLIISINLGTCQDGKPKFRILAPQFICGPQKNGENKTTVSAAVPGVTSIRLQTKAGQMLTYNWTVRFKVLEGPRGQRFNLMVWRAVRGLEKVLNSMSAEIAKSNSVSINNTMLVGGVDYVFKISGVSENGILGDTDNFSIKFTDANSQPKLDLGSFAHEQFSLLMLGSEVTYADITYIIEAHVTPCKPTNDYYFSWSVTDLKSTNNVDIGQQLGKRLTILPETLTATHMYDITVKVLRVSDGGLITTNGIFITVLTKGMTVEINIESMNVATATPFSLIATLKNPDNVQGNLFYDWSCKAAPDLNECENFKSLNQSEINFEGGLPDEGTYLFEVTIVKGNAKASNKVTITVQKGMLPMIDLGNSPRLVASNRAVEIQAQVLDLRPGCNLQWLLLNEKGYGFFDTSSLPKVFENSVSINSREETFLSEIVEFSNNTLVRNFPLVLPAPTDSWSGLEPDVNYKFRLLVQCICTPSVQCEGPANVTVYSDVTIAVNGPPVPAPVTVKPSRGTALKTIFQFTTSAATDLLKDFPLMYIFKYKLSSTEVVIINSYIENLVTETILPFSDTPLIPVLTVCDSRDACATIDGEPIVVLLPKEITDTELNNFKDRFKVNLYRNEYSDAFLLVSTVLQTIKALNIEADYQSFLSSIEKLTRADIARQMAGLDEINVMTSNDFIKESTKFIQKFTVSEDLLQDILKLRDNVFEIISQSSKNDKSSRIVSHGSLGSRIFQSRKLLINVESDTRNRFKRDVSTEDVKNFLKVSEYIILTSKDVAQVQKEKKKIISNLEIAAPDLCKTSTKYPSILDSQFLFISVERINLRPSTGFTYVPYFPRVGNKVNLTTVAELQIPPNEKLTSNSYCITKYAFQFDILSEDYDKNQIGWVYHSSLYLNDGNTFKALDNDFSVILRLPIMDLQIKADEIIQCRRWKDEWTNTCETNEKYEVIDGRSYALCKCDKLGYISLYVAPRPTTTTPLSTISSVMSTVSTTDSMSFSRIVTEIPFISSSTQDFTNMQSTLPSTNVQSTLPSTNVQSTLPSTNVQSTLPFTNLQSTLPSTSVQSTLPFINVQTTLPSAEHNLSFLEIKSTQEVLKISDSRDLILMLAISIPCLILCAIAATTLLRRKWKNKTDVQNISVLNLVSKNTPKYGKFYAEHLMEGTRESLEKYNILGDT